MDKKASYSDGVINDSYVSDDFKLKNIDIDNPQNNNQNDNFKVKSEPDNLKGVI